ncbi:hypothetical protein JCM8208_004824 [Rhodotorula glutinis]
MVAAPDDDGFTSVTHKKPVRPPRNRKGKNRFIERTLDQKLEARHDALQRSGYLDKCREMVRLALSPPANDDERNDAPPAPCPPPRCVVCLGLGSISESSKAQDQYVLLKEVLDELKDELDETMPTEFYDPVFSPEDAAFLSAQGHKVLSSDHPLRLDRTTLLYIPHGPRTLFGVLLRANWTSPAQLERVVLLANRLDLYDDPTYSGSLGTKARRDEAQRQEGEDDELGSSAEYIVRAAELFHIVPFPPTKEHLEAFNDLALEWAVPARLEGKDPAFWLADGPVDSTEDEVDEAAKAVEALSLGKATT